MNAGIYRLVFNAVRGMFVAVDETAHAHGNGQPAHRAAPREAAAGIPLWFAARATTFAALCLFGMQPLVADAQSTLPITPDRSGNSHPVVTTSAAGIPVINITAPGKAGVSNNRFTQYNVGTSGAVIANNGQNAQTQIAGWVQGNPFIGNNAAKLILFQVTGGAGSQLLGPTEIAGQRAPFVLANPAGITCSGCGFLNIPRATLTTGLPNFNADGTLAGFNVTLGNIAIGSGGLSAQGTPIDLIARAMTINGQVWAQSINAVAGANQIDYATSNATPQAATGPAPQFAIDVQALGSMYGDGAVRMIGTEAGVGVHDVGGITSLNGDIELSANGDVTIDAPGKIQAQRSVGIAASNLNNAGMIVTGAGMLGVNASGGIGNSGAMQSAADLVLAAPAIGNTGVVVAAGNTTLAGQTVANRGEVGAGVSAAAGADNVNQSGALTVNAAQLTNSGQMHAGTDATLNVGTATLDNGGVSAAGALQVKASGAVSNRGGTLVSGGPQSVSAASLDNSGGQVSSGAQATIDVAASLINDAGSITAQSGGQIASGSVSNVKGTIGTVAGPLGIASGTFDNHGGQVLAGAALALDTSAFDNTAGTVSSGADLTLAAAGVVSNANGTMTAQNGLTVAGGAIDNSHGTFGTVTGPLALTTPAALTNIGGQLLAGTGAHISAGSFDSAGGTLSAGTDANLRSTGAVTNDGGSMTAGNNLTIDAASLSNHNGVAGTQSGSLAVTTTGATDNASGQMIGAAGATVEAGSVINDRGVMSSGAQMRIASPGEVSNVAGTLTAATGLTVQGASLANTDGASLGTVTGTVSVTAAGVVDNRGSQIASGGDLSIASQSFRNDEGTASAQGAANIRGTDALTNVHGSLAANGAVELGGASLDNHGGKIGSVNDAVTAAVAGTLDNSAGGSVLAKGDVTLVAGSVSNAGGTVAGANVGVNTGSGAFNNAAGVVFANDALSLRTGAVNNRGGSLEASGALTAVTNGQAFDNSASGKVVGGSVALTTGGFENDTGLVSAAAAANVVAASLSNRAGSVVAGGPLGIASAAAVDNQGGLIGGNGDVTVSGTAIDNTAGAMHAGGTLRLTGTTLTNAATSGASVTTSTGVGAMTAGVQGANVDVNVSQSLDNSSGQIRADQSLAIATAALLNTSGDIETPGALSLTGLGDFTNAGNLNGGASLTVGAATIANSGTMQSSGDVNVNAAGALENRGRMIAGHDLHATAGGALTNDGSMTAANAANVASASVVNADSGEIVGNVATNVSAAGDVANAGLIDGGATKVTAGGTLTNTGRLYGDSVSLGASAIANDANAEGVGGVIASRGDLDMGANTITNQNGALVYAQGDMRIGGALDANGHASGTAGTVTNDGTQIQSGGSMTIDTGTLNNLNSNFQTSTVTTDTGTQLWFTIPGSTTQYAPTDVAFYQVNNQANSLGGPDWQRVTGDDDYYRIVLPSDQYPFSRFGTAPVPSLDDRLNAFGVYTRDPRTVDWTNPANPNDVREVNNLFAIMPGDPKWALFGVASPPPMPDYVGPMLPGNNIPGNRTITLSGNDAVAFCRGSTISACAPVTQWINDTAAAYAGLEAAIDAYNTSYRSRLRDAWTAYQVDTRTSTPVVTATQPGQIISGGAMTINAGTGVNDKSQIVAGGNAQIVANVLDNSQPTGQQVVTATGTAIYSHVGGGGSAGGDARHNDTTPYNPAPVVTTVDLPVSAPNPAGSSPVKQVALDASGAQGANGGGVTTPGARGVSSGGFSAGGVSTAGGSVSTVSANLSGLVVRTVAPNLTLPNNQLYQVATTPGSPFLIVTDPRFANYQTWSSGSYMLEQLRSDPGNVERFIGDGFYQQQLVQQQIIDATGHKYIGDYTDNQTEFQALMNNGVQAARQLDLNVGTALTDAQMAALTSDIVWLVNQTVTLPDGTTQTVLVPQVYLISSSAAVTGTGAVIAGKNVSVNGAQVMNSGTIASQSVTVVTAGNITNSGTLSGGTVLATATNDLSNLGGLIQGNTVALAAGHDLNLTSTTQATQGTSGSAVRIDRVASVNAGNVTMAAGHDLNASAANLQATGDATLAAGNDVNLNAVTQSVSDHVTWSAQNNAQRAASVDTGTQLSAGNDLTVAAGHDVNATAAYANAGNALSVAAGHDVNLMAGQQTVYANDEHQQTEHGFLSSKSTHTIDTESRTNAVGTTLSGNTVAVQAGNDVTVAGSTVAGTGDVVLSAGRDLNVTTANTSSGDYHYREEHRSGFGAMGGISYGTMDTKATTTETVTGTQGSLIGSTGGSVSLNAGRDLHITGSDLIAAQDVTGVGANVTIDAARAARQYGETHETKSSGFSVGLAGSIGNALNSSIDQGRAVNSGGGDARAAALHTIAAAGNAAMAGVGGVMLASGNATGPNKPDIGVQLSFGTSRSRSDFTETQTTNTGSSVTAGGMAAFVATGDGTPGSGNVTVAGSNVTAGDVLLAAKNQVNLVNTTDTDSTRSSNSSSSASVRMANLPENVSQC